MCSHQLYSLHKNISMFYMDGNHKLNSSGPTLQITGCNACGEAEGIAIRVHLFVSGEHITLSAFFETQAHQFPIHH